MQLIQCGIAGSTTAISKTWQEVGCDEELGAWLDALTGNRPLRPIQQLVVHPRTGMFSSRKHIIAAAPTNGGKRLVGELALLEAAQKGKRAVLLEPLRALAQEKFQELKAKAAVLKTVLGRQVQVQITTGDYRLDAESLTSPPPEDGEWIIATPERLDAIYRNPPTITEDDETVTVDYGPWLDSIGVVVVDEAQLLRDSRRGMTLEYLLTSFLVRPHPPRIVLLSATLGETTQLEQWLQPCEVYQVQGRTPPLTKAVLAIDENEQCDDLIVAQMKEWLESDETAQALVFVYQTRSTSSLANKLSKQLPELVGAAGAQFFHSQMSQQQRKDAREKFIQGASRVLVTTSSLAMGMNLPCSHVLVRDNTYPGENGKTLEVGELLQMMGRAGRGDRNGIAYVCHRPSDQWDRDELVQALSNEPIPPFEGGLVGLEEQQALAAVATRVGVQLRRNPEGLTLNELETFFERSLGGHQTANKIPEALDWMALRSRLLAHQEEERYKLTTLGRLVITSSLTPEFGTGFGSLIRDFLSLDSEDSLLKWKPLDWLILVGLLSERSPSLVNFSEKLVDDVEKWMENHSEIAPLLYYRWIKGKQGFAKTEELAGSLLLRFEGTHQDKIKHYWQKGYKACFNAIILWERAEGRKVEDLERRFKIPKGKLNGLDEKLRDEALFPLNGLRHLLDVRCWYFHLKETLQADDARIERVQQNLKAQRRTLFEVQEKLRYCSPLGDLLLKTRQLHQGSKAVIGIMSVRKLEAQGIIDAATLRQHSLEQLKQMGVQDRFARQLLSVVTPTGGL